MAKFVPPGHAELLTIIEQHNGDVDAVRNKLFTGELQAVRFDEYRGALYEIFPGDWSQMAATYWLQTGLWSTSAIDRVREPILVVLPKETPAPAPSLEGVYLSPFMVMMVEAVKKFKITDQLNPRLRKEELEDHFKSQKLPDGTPLSKHLAETMATLIRPPAAMKGGNKRMG